MTEFLRTQCHTTQHPFDDVAVVAKQSARRVCVVAVIRAYLAAVKRTLAYATFAFLQRVQFGEKRRTYARSVNALSLQDLGPTLGVGPLHIVEFLGTGLGLCGLRVCTSFCRNFWFSVTCSAARFYLRARRVFPQAFAFRIYADRTTCASLREVVGPFLGRTISFQLSHNA